MQHTPFRHDSATTGDFRFDPLDSMDMLGMSLEEATQRAKKVRAEWASMHRKLHPGFEVRLSSLRGQLREWKSFGVPDGRVRTVFYATVRRIE